MLRRPMSMPLVAEDFQGLLCVTFVDVVAQHIHMYGKFLLY